MDIIGANTFVEIEGISNIPAKIDTGAKSSSLHTDYVSILEDGTLSFGFFGNDIRTKDYKVVLIRSSNGEEQLRYRTSVTIKIAGRKIRTMVTLADRSKNDFPVLIGSRAIKNKFLVDVSKADIVYEKKPKLTYLNEELRNNPFKFHQKYIKSNQERKK